MSSEEPQDKKKDDGNQSIAATNSHESIDDDGLLVSSAEIPTKPDEERNVASAVEAQETDDAGTENESSMEDEDDDDKDVLPLLYYTRVQGTSLRPPPMSANDNNNEEEATSLPFSEDCTCSNMGQIRWSPDMLAVEPGGTPDVFFRTGRPDAAAHSPASPSGANTSDGGLPSTPQQLQHETQQFHSQEEEAAAAAAAAAKLSMEEPMPVVAVGFANGTVQLLDGRSLLLANNGGGIAVPLVSGDALLQVREGKPTRGGSFPPIVAVCLDASGTCLAAIDGGGMCAIWEYKLEFVRRSVSQPTSSAPSSPSRRGTAAASNDNASSTAATTTTGTSVFSSFMSAITGSAMTGGGGANDTTASASSPNAPGAASGMLGSWRISALQVTRLSYPASFGKPTVLALDPTYKRRREKAILVGFADGRLIMTKRGLLFQRRFETVIYQQAGGKATGGASEEGGILALTWRGSLVAWADSTGIRLLDADQLARIAHIDPPVGARPSLYAHQLVDMKPHLCFETSQNLLVAWGDCLLQLRIRDAAPSGTASSAAPGTGSASSSSQPPQVSPQAATETADEQEAAPTGGENSADAPAVVRRRTVECSMAWQLDCVACGVAPLDSEHVMVLGAVVSPPLEEEEDDEVKAKPSPRERVVPQRVENEIELQMISRANGQVTYADLLPLVRKPLETDKRRGSKSPVRRLRASRKSQSSSPPQPESVAAFSLLSTFQLPRMDDSHELQEQVVVPETSFDLFGGAASGGSVIPGASLVSAAASGVVSMPSGRSSKSFRDPHLRWNLDMVSFEVVGDEEDEKEPEKEEPDTSMTSMDDNDSVDSDIYDFVTRPVKQQRTLGIDRTSNDGAGSNSTASSSVAQAPGLLIVSGSDAISVRLRTIDDTVDHFLEHEKAATALQRAIVYSPGLRQYNMGEIVNEFFRSLLRLPPVDENEDKDAENKEGADPKLSLRRMKLAAASMPVLLGGDVDLWSKWIGALGDIAGSLFVVWGHIPVRDPLLPMDVYTNALRRMIENCSTLRTREDDGVNLDRLVVEAENHFLQALLAWGSTLVLKDFLKLFKYQADVSPKFSAILSGTEKSLQRRYKQTSAVYLSFPVEIASPDDTPIVGSSGNESPQDVGTLFNVETLMVFLTGHAKQFPESSKVVYEAKARLSMMKGDFDAALKNYLTLGALHGPTSLEEVETTAVASVMDPENVGPHNDVSHAFVIALIENRHLHQCLLDTNFISDKTRVPPIFALLRLVGLDLVGDFLMEHCVSPREAVKKQPYGRRAGPAQTDTSQTERSGTLPLDIVAAQLEASPKILFWYLHCLFCRKPEMYVSFPKTANLPSAITALHRKHLDLYIKFSGDKRDSAKALEGIEAYRVTQVDTPLLTFLKVVLQLGGMSPAEVGKRLQIERKGGAGVSRVFALELAFIMENFGNDTPEDSRLILDLYLKGAKSLMHAVSFAQRKKEYSSQLWEILIEYCLTTSTDKKPADSSADGSLFGLLLESAALSGANLAHLVSQIPPGMSIEGLRPRLVAAVADYRWKLEISSCSAQVAESEKIDLLREVAHRSRRGKRYYPSDRIKVPVWAKALAAEGDDGVESEPSEPVATLPKDLRPRIRKQHNFLSYSLATGLV